MQLFSSSSFAPPESLRLRRDRAERILNGLRAVVVFLLTASALMYAPHLSPALNIVNVLVLGPMLLWTIAQYMIWYRRPELPDWLSAVNPIVAVFLGWLVLGEKLAPELLAGSTLVVIGIALIVTFRSPPSQTSNRTT